MQKSYLIADSGSTKTDWVIKNSSGEHSFQSAGINPFYQTAEEIIPVLEKEVIPNLMGTVGKIYFFGAGCADEKTSRPVFDALTKCISSADMIEVASDMLGAARGLCGHEAGLACILGTGANNAFYDGTNIVRSIGSLGFWLGDEGSGSYLGKTLVVHFLQNELPEHLHLKFAAQFPEVNRLSVLENAYKKPYPNRYFASFSKFIAENKSDPFLENVVSSAFAIFAKKYICKHPEAQTVPIHFTGSVAYYYQDILKNVLEILNLKPGRILRSPLEGLLQYYS
ncbi:N-acetylglucosamine kinase [Dyadobacter chenwenxiniae]|uniref:N-acetylglucosamine kinase n=1 Tax=Dyadobacter chenwenxiniae TaxID=2906456 RepID=A0A9X1PQ06_9BACT|nr:N-acetylglucosamine kinase [Dyadobacter chenwenxiniae]MCF0065377.1 N-acetylglucosamine kinase [Dyadobacter chenwenxiniae]UON82211.1 N-acetylglucosamine kinase [Dyadobacter chenwenxiniae]